MPALRGAGRKRDKMSSDQPTILYGTPPIDGGVPLYACPDSGWFTPLPDQQDPLPSPEEMKEIAMEIAVPPTDGKLLRKAIRRYVLEPWAKAMAEHKHAEEMAGYNGAMQGPPPPSPRGIISELRSLAFSTPSSLAQRMHNAEVTDKAEAQAEFDKAEREYLRARAKLEGMDP